MIKVVETKSKSKIVTIVGKQERKRQRRPIIEQWKKINQKNEKDNNPNKLTLSPTKAVSETIPLFFIYFLK